MEDKPKIAPSIAQAEIRSKHKKNNFKNEFLIFKQSLKNLFKNLNYCLIFVSYGVITGISFSISTLFNQIISQYHKVKLDLFCHFLKSCHTDNCSNYKFFLKNQNENIGVIGLIFICSGLIGSIVGGVTYF